MGGSGQWRLLVGLALWACASLGVDGIRRAAKDWALTAAAASAAGEWFGLLDDALVPCAACFGREPHPAAELV